MTVIRRISESGARLDSGAWHWTGQEDMDVARQSHGQGVFLICPRLRTERDQLSQLMLTYCRVTHHIVLLVLLTSYKNLRFCKRSILLKHNFSFHGNITRTTTDVSPCTQSPHSILSLSKFDPLELSPNTLCNEQISISSKLRVRR